MKCKYCTHFSYYQNNCKIGHISLGKNTTACKDFEIADKDLNLEEKPE